MKVLIVEEALETLDGHWFQYLRDLVEGGRHAGHEIEVLCHVDAHPLIRETFNAHPVLKQSVWHRSFTGGMLARLKSIYVHQKNLTSQVCEFLSEKSFDVILFPTVRVDHVPALKALSKKSGARVIGILAESPGFYDSSGTLQFPRSASLFRILLKRAHHDVEFATESDGLRDQYLRFSNTDTFYLPHVTQTAIEEKIPSTGDLRMGTFGFTRFDKGTDILHEALHQKTFANLQTFIQWTGDYELPDGTQITRDSGLENVTYLDRFERSEDYAEWLTKIDFMVLPYRREFYWDKLSRVAIDAAQASLPMIYPSGTWLADFVESHAVGISFEPENPTSLAEAIEKMVTQFPTLHDQAIEKAPEVQHHFSGAHFFECLTK